MCFKNANLIEILHRRYLLIKKLRDLFSVRIKNFKLKQQLFFIVII